MSVVGNGKLLGNLLERGNKKFAACQMFVNDVYELIITPRHFWLPSPSISLWIIFISRAFELYLSFFIKQKASCRSLDDLLIFHDNEKTGQEEYKKQSFPFLFVEENVNEEKWLWTGKYFSKNNKTNRSFLPL